MARTITEILKEADAAKQLKQLINLWNEIANNKREYPLNQIYFANEHIRDLCLNSKGSDLVKNVFYKQLENQMLT